MGRTAQHLAVVTLTALLSSVQADLPTYYMDEWCSTTLDLGVQGIEAGRLLLRPPSRGMRFLNCFVFLRAHQGRRLSFSFMGFDVQSPFGCDSDHMQIFDDSRMNLELTGRMCNGGEVPEGMYTSTARDATVRLSKKRYLGDQVEIIFTAFHLAPCKSGEFHCANSHCIAESLYCNDYDNCGDGSDICLLSTAGIIAVVIGAIVFVLLVAVIVAVILYRRQQHRRLEKLHMRQYVVVQDAKGRPVVLHEDHVHYVDAWDKKSSIPDSPSTTSSRLSRDRVKMGTVLGGSGRGDTLTKKPIGSSFRSNKRSSGKLSSLRNSSFKSSSKSKKSKTSGSGGVRDIYAVPKKTKKFNWKRKPTPAKYTNTSHHHQQQQEPPSFIQPPALIFPMQMSEVVKATDSGGRVNGVVPPAAEMTETKPGVREGMMEQSERDIEMPVHTLDPATLPGARHHLHPHDDDVYDHVMSFRSYTSPEQRRKERVVYLYPQGHPGYHHLHQHGHEEALLSDRLSSHSSRSSLVKL
ncbi:uncharacterized protein LOC143285646 [Babylonia areolata]|uniref:uncharacterized protein LOC143285646 n=1 Tax=Babylonia areolata TaxID=304850 RepID=UPI003FD158FE